MRNKRRAGERTMREGREGVPWLVTATASVLAGALSGCSYHHVSSWSNFELVAPDPAGNRASWGLFETVSGDWKVVDRVDVPSPPQAVQQDHVGAKDDFNLLLVTGAKAEAGTLSVRLRALDGTIDQGGGLVWRAQSPRDYYLARWNPLENNVRAYVVKDGVRTMLASEGVELGDGWHALAITFDDDRIEVALDGQVKLAFDHSAQFPAGRFGVWTKADARTQFDDLAIAD